MYNRLSSTYGAIMLTHEDLTNLIDYSQETGLFVWKKKRRGVVIGKTLGADNGFGYLRITVLGKSYYAHRLAWFYVHKVWPDTIDHINGCKADNRILNLKNCSMSENNQNKHGPQTNSKSQTLGVSWHKKAKKWQAHICVYKERKYLGLFDNVMDAQKAYLIEKEKANVYS
jgi:hypothetical protein